MSAEIIQADFGGFNPRFMGVSMKLTSLEAFQIWQDYFIGEKNISDNEFSLLEVATRSVLEHEVRHYHDFLISPYSSYLLRMRIQALVNGAVAFNCMSQLEGNCLPIPISRWLVMDEAERAAQLEDWQTSIQPPEESGWHPVVLPIKSRDDLLIDTPPQIKDARQIPVKEQFDLNIDAAVKGYMRIGQIVGGFGNSSQYPERHPCNVYEATALTVQCVSIYQTQGELPALKFIEYLKNSNLGYARLWQQFFQLALLLGKQRPPEAQESGQETKAIMTMGVWCLLGNYQMESTKACPTVRYENLHAHLSDDYHDPRNWNGTVAAIWDYWDDQIGSVPWRLCMQELLNANQRGLSSYNRLSEYWESGVLDVIIKIMESFVEEQQQMVQRLFSHPEQVVDPSLYLNAKAGAFPLPCIKVELDGFVVPKSWLKSPLRSIWDVDLEGQSYSSRFVSLLPGIKDDEKHIEAVLLFENLMNWCDMAFSDHSVSWEVFEHARRELEKLTKKRVLLIV
jgi:hypothetical protein